MFFYLTCRLKVHPALVNATIRRTPCVVVVDVHPITFKSPPAPSVVIQLPRLVLVSKLFGNYIYT